MQQQDIVKIGLDANQIKNERDKVKKDFAAHYHPYKFSAGDYYNKVQYSKKAFHPTKEFVDYCNAINIDWHDKLTSMEDRAIEYYQGTYSFSNSFKQWILHKISLKDATVDDDYHKGYQAALSDMLKELNK